MPTRRRTDDVCLDAPAGSETSVARPDRPHAVVTAIIAVTIGSVLAIPLLSLSTYGVEVPRPAPHAPAAATSTP